MLAITRPRNVLNHEINKINLYFQEKTALPNCYIRHRATSGVSQDSHLGPLLFFLYVNDDIHIYIYNFKLVMEIPTPANNNFFDKHEKYYKWYKISRISLNYKV